MTINDVKLIHTSFETIKQLIERLVWLKALLIKNGICPDCGEPDTMHDQHGMLWCANCNASYNYTEEVKAQEQKEVRGG